MTPTTQSEGSMPGQTAALHAAIPKDSIETAYCFLHQKRNVYIHSSLDWQKDDIEYAIASYAESMNQQLYDALSGGRPDFLREHRRFMEDITKAVELLESIYYQDSQTGAHTGMDKD